MIYIYVHSILINYAQRFKLQTEIVLTTVDSRSSRQLNGAEVFRREKKIINKERSRK